MNETPNPTPDDERREPEHRQQQEQVPAWEPPHADRASLRPAYAFDGSGPYLYGPDGSGPYAYSPDGRGPYRVGSPALGGTPQGGPASGQYGGGRGDQYGAANPSAPHGWTGAFGTAPGTNRRSRKLALAIGSGIAALAIVGAAGGTALGLSSVHTTTTSSQGSSSQGTTPGSGSGSTGDGSGTNGFTVPGQGTDGSGTGGSGTGGTGGSGSGSTSESAATAATAAQKKGVVTIDTVIGYDQSQQAAGTGMVLTSDGTVLTNNHVIQGATSIRVTDETTGKQYTADVVGADATNDVAVLKLRDASGLSTVTLGDDGGASTGDAITDVGNAEGTGDLVAATGTVTATDQDIQVQSESGTGTESLTGLLQLAAQVVSGDSGGPVLDSEGEVVGMATAASSGTADVTGFAIPISTAKSIADKILAGDSSGTITIGLPAFLGVQISSTATGTTSGVPIAGTVEGSGAASAGLAAGDTITSVDGTAVTSSEQLTKLISGHGVGDEVAVGYTTSDGTAKTVTVTLTAGPAA
ncbi:trypsin-like peptidase domain-containing protein [Curtobacterium herbarum]|uniref:PDZ domain-containing protein n=1 Tax=Curtobacterium herbarum TaxID=150122 RepID=A0ABN1ZF69_9MICO|nr:trypsin-like peptidase domain-containing protein [Curtobacterium herbarum]MBM7475813.1 S1-C subfamily serine protease [Curtobacterium herbarum]MCS6543723.1 S1C family serine protease [Curtobacterium herbarum]